MVGSLDEVAEGGDVGAAVNVGLVEGAPEAVGVEVGTSDVEGETVVGAIVGR